MGKLVITIGRTFGSGGSIIGRQVAAKLGIAYYDRARIDSIAHERGLDKGYIPNWQDNISSLDIWGANDPASQLWNLNCWRTGSPYYSNEKEMFLVQSRLIEELAQEGPCVFVGRCADHLLRNRKPCLRVWISADESSRALRLYDEYLIRTGSLAEKMQMVDRGRAVYYKRCTGQNWGEHSNYHMHLDSGALGLRECTRIICDAAAKFSLIEY